MSSEQAQRRARTKVALVSLVASSVEWYDFFLYATAAALVFPAVFFSSELTPLTALIAAYSTFAVGFVARPIGGIVFGHFGDRYGRKRALIVALYTMGIGSTAIGLLPTYMMVGDLAVLLLVLLRFVQGLAIGGQWGGAMLLVTETAPADKRGFYGAFAQAGAVVGIILANLAYLLVSLNLSQEDFLSWGWRVPFLVSIGLVFLAIYSHHHIEDTPAFKLLAAEMAKKAQSGDTTKAVVAANRKPVIDAIKKYPKEILLVAGALIANNVAIYIYVSFVIAYGANPAGLGLPRNLMLTSVLMSSVIMVPAIFAFAALSDRIGRRKVFLAGAILLGIWAFVSFPLIDTGSLLWITVAITFGEIFIAMIYGPGAALVAEQFSTEVRYSAASLGYQGASIFGGGLAPIIATALLAEFGTPLAISAYMAFTCLLTVVSVLFLKETYGRELTNI